MIDFHNHVLPNIDDGSKFHGNVNRDVKVCFIARYYGCSKYCTLSASKNGKWNHQLFKELEKK